MKQKKAAAQKMHGARARKNNDGDGACPVAIQIS